MMKKQMKKQVYNPIVYHPVCHRPFILIKILALISLIILPLYLEACGFHLRGHFDFPAAFNRIKICPNHPYDPFQRTLIQALNSNGIDVITAPKAECQDLTTLFLFNQKFSERTIGFGSDTEVNRSIIEFTLQYRVEDCEGNILCPEATVQVQRELSISPSAVLSTENERARLRADLYLDATTQLMRQLSVSSYANTSQ